MMVARVVRRSALPRCTARAASAFVFVAFVIAPGVFAQDVRSELLAARQAVYDADLRGDWDALDRAREHVIRFAGDPVVGTWARYYGAYADWRRSSLAWLAAGPAGQVRLVERAVTELERVIASEPRLAEAHALLATCIAVLMGADPSRRDALLPRLITASRSAQELAPSNARVQLLRVIGEFARATAGSEEQTKAITRWHDVMDLFEHDRVADPLAPDWGYVEGLAWLGGAHLARGEFDEARAQLERALAHRPDFWWVRTIALPQARNPIR